MNSRHAGPHASAVGRTVPQDPALTLSGAPGGWGRPVPGSCGSGRWWAGSGIDWPRTCLRLLLLSKSAMVKTPAVLTVGVSLCLWIFPAAASGQQLIRARCADSRLVPLRRQQMAQGTVKLFNSTTGYGHHVR